MLSNRKAKRLPPGPAFFQNLSLNKKYAPKISTPQKSKLRNRREHRDRDSKSANREAHMKKKSTNLEEQDLLPVEVLSNRVVFVPKHIKRSHLVSFTELTSCNSMPPQAALFTTFGFETDFFESLLDYAKVYYLDL